MTDILSTPKKPSRKPYIYKVTNFETGQYYIGSQCIGKTVGVNYFTSSTNKEFWEDFKTYGEEKYKITIIKSFTDPDECVHAENYMIRDHMQLKDGLCLNRAYFCGDEKVFSRLGTHHSEETKQKMRVAKKGFHNSEETRKKMSRAKKGRPATNRIKISIEGTFFNSLTEASKYYNMSTVAIRKWIKKNQHNAVYVEK